MGTRFPERLPFPKLLSIGNLYFRVCNLTQDFPNVPIMVLTATATEK